MAGNLEIFSWTQSASSAAASTINGLNQVAVHNGTSFTHDANGNFTSDGAMTYGYDVENRMVSVAGATNATLTYDPMGRLASYAPGASNAYLYDGDERIAEYDSAGTLTRRYVYGPGTDEPLVSYQGATLATRSFLHADERGSIVARTDLAGAVTAINRYDEYGIPASSNSGSHGYTGQMWLPELNLWYYRARIYSSELGRFMQVDPVGYEDQINLYAYVGNDPINRSDPTGEEAPSCYGPSLCGTLEPTPEQEERRRTTLRVLATVAITVAPVGRLFSSVVRGVGAARAFVLWRSLPTAFRTAAQGGRHSGMLANYANRPVIELRRGIRSLDREIAEHQAKLANPARHIQQTSGRDWTAIRESERQSLIRRWQNDINRQREERDVLPGLERLRRGCTGTILCFGGR